MRTLSFLIAALVVMVAPVTSSAYMHVTQYEAKTHLVDNYKQNKALVESRVRLIQTNQDTKEFYQAAFEANMQAVRETVNSFDCYTGVNPAACKPAKE